MECKPVWKVKIVGCGWSESILCFNEEEVSGLVKSKLANYGDVCIKIEPFESKQEGIMGCSGECDFCPDADGCEQCGSV
jgi:hypothetical protein